MGNLSVGNLSVSPIKSDDSQLDLNQSVASPDKINPREATMKVLWLFAHPEQRSLSGALRDEGLRALAEDGHEHQLSDHYAMGWNPIVGCGDFENHDDKGRLLVASASQEAYQGGTLSEDIRAE